jgi:hypothetical protein
MQLEFVFLLSLMLAAVEAFQPRFGRAHLTQYSVEIGRNRIAPKALLDSAAIIVTDMSMDSMPPMYIPVLFAVAILGGVGYLQLSLGDVYTQEADLGASSGANAKKEMERKSKSYFKKTSGQSRDSDIDA